MKGTASTDIGAFRFAQHTLRGQCRSKYCDLVVAEKRFVLLTRAGQMATIFPIGKGVAICYNRILATFEGGMVMAKAASPVRLQEELMKSARVMGTVQHRSTAEQIEYWADIGRKVSRIIDADALLAVEAGLARIKVEKVKSVAVDPATVFATLDADRESGALASAIAEKSPIRYQASKRNPGLLEQVDSAGNIVVGRFLNGEFIPTNAK